MFCKLIIGNYDDYDDYDHYAYNSYDLREVRVARIFIHVNDDDVEVYYTKTILMRTVF